MSDFIIENGILTKYQGPGGDVVIPDGVTEIGGSAFSGCKSLKSVIIPSGVTKINDSTSFFFAGAFRGCENLTSVTIPDGVTAIGDEAFSGCTSLTSVVIPESVTSIGDWAFYGCKSLTSVTIPEGVTSIGGSAFSGCAGLADEQGLMIVHGVLYDCLKKDVVSVTIPENVTSIGFLAFHGCRDLIDVTFRRAVHVGGEMFSGCDKLCRLEMPIGQLPKMNGEFDEEKTVTLTLHLEDGSEVRMEGCFRKYSYLVPIGKENIKVYDRLVAVGKCEGFRMPADMRIRAALRRLTDKEEPVSGELRPLFAEFLAGKLQKAVNFAEDEQNAAYIRALADVGAVTDANRKKVQKMLKASTVPEIKNMADELGAPAAGQPLAAAENGPAGEYADRLKQLKAAPLLVQYGVTSIPAVMLKDGSGAAPEEYLRLILAEYITLYKKGGAFAVPLADKAAAKLERTSLLSALWQLHDMQSDGNSQMMASIPLIRYGGSVDVDKLCRQWKKDGQGTKYLNKALMFSDTRAAMLYMDKMGRLWEYAQLRGTDAETLRDTAMVDFGLDAAGKKAYDLGGRTVTASVGQDLKIALYDGAEGKELKSLPKKGADPEKYAAACADLAELKKNVKKVAKARSDKLFGDFLRGNTYNADKWQKVYLGNSVLRRVAELLVWSQGDDTFTLGQDGPIKSSGAAYTITDTPVAVAHPIEMAPAEVSAWQQYFTANGLKQPFEQVWEPVIDPKTICPERYEGLLLPMVYFRGREKHGIRYSDDDFHNDIYFTLTGCQLDNWRTTPKRHALDPDETFTLGKFSFRKYNRQVNHIVALLDRWTVAGRILKDDVSVREQLDGFTAAQIMEYIRLASENACPNCAAMLLEYKQAHYPDFDPMAEFTLE